MMRNGAAESAARPPPAHDATDVLIALLLTSLEALAAAGKADAACRLAGQACAFYRTTDEVAWSKFNKLLHRLSRYVERDALAAHAKAGDTDP